MSATQDAASTVNGKSWKGLSGWGKVGVAGCAVVALGAIVILPGLGGNTGSVQTGQNNDDVSTVEKFKPHVTQASLTRPITTPIASGQGAAATHHLPPPIEIGAYVAPSPPPPPSQGQRSQYPGGYAGQMPPGGGVTPVMVPMPGSGAAPAGPTPSSLQGQVSGAVTLQTMTASVLPHPDYTITAGTKIPCVTVEAADSTLGGFYTCRVPEWVRGTTQARGLIPPGSIVFGQMKKGMEQGQERVGILFTRIQTAGDNIVIPLAAPAADALGRPGMTGEVDTHFWDKVGDVALYALIDGLQGALTQAPSALLRSGGGNSFLNLGTVGGSTGGQSLASMELQNRINRPPVMRINQGIQIDASVGQDLDFYGACMTRVRVNPMACPEQ